MDMQRVERVADLMRDARRQQGQRLNAFAFDGLALLLGEMKNLGRGHVIQFAVICGPLAHALLDEAALNAVQSWVYTPTLLDGRPVPIIMTVTVNFRLE